MCVCACACARARVRVRARVHAAITDGMAQSRAAVRKTGLKLGGGVSNGPWLGLTSDC